ncbi:MAG: class I SAM-dependent methyltransferase [Pseudomonadota bacterium]
MTTSGELHRYFLSNGDRRLHKWLHYFDIYERHFARFRAGPIRMLEIGVHGGGSLRMWRDYFHPESQIVGIDIDPDCAVHASGGIAVHIGSQDDPEFLRDVVETYGGFDIILDDGSHVNSHVIKTFETLYEHVSRTGAYLVEDMHTSYWPKYGGGLCREGSFIEFAKAKIDELNAPHVGGSFEVTPFTRATDSITFYDSVVVFERRPQGRRQHVITEAL